MKMTHLEFMKKDMENTWASNEIRIYHWDYVLHKLDKDIIVCSDRFIAEQCIEAVSFNYQKYKVAHAVYLDGRFYKHYEFFDMINELQEGTYEY